MPQRTPKAKLAPKKARQSGVEKPLDTSWHPAFLRALEQSGNVRLSCKAAGITSPNAYDHRQRFPEFAAAWDEAKELAIDYLEAVARKRAAASSDTLLIFLLKSLRPEVYRETYRAEHTGADGGPIRHEYTPSQQDAWLAARVKELAERDQAAHSDGTGEGS